jgi:SPOR domain
MTLSNTSVPPIDLDDLERQLREAAVSSLPRKSDDPLAELARIVGRDNSSLRGVASGRAQTPETSPYRAGAQGGSVGDAFDLEASIKEALRANHSHDAMEDLPETAFDEDGHEARDEHVSEDGSHPYAEEWEEQTDEDHAAYADEAGRFDAIEQVPDMPDGAHDAPVGRRGISPRALALAVPLILVGVGVCAAVVMRAGPLSRISGDAPVIKADDTPVKVLPAKAAGDQQTPSETALGAADPSGKPGRVVLARAEQPVDVVAAAKAAQPRDLAVAQPPASSGIVILSGPGAAKASGSTPASADGGSVPGSGILGGVASSATAPSAQPLPTAAANVPLPEPPQPAAQASVFGTPHRVSTVSVKPDGTIVSNGKPRVEAKTDIKTDIKTDAKPDTAPPAKPLTMASAEPATSAPAATGSVTPAARKPADTTRAKPSAVIAADDQQATKTTKPAVKPVKAKVAEATAPDPGASQNTDAGAPLPITPQGRHGRTTLASAAPPQVAEPAATSSNATSSAASSGSFAIQLASSPSESDAHATLTRLQKQFPNELGGGAIHRADLGSKGVFYRVRVGPLSREAADKICTQLKAGGAECILTRG